MRKKILIVGVGNVNGGIEEIVYNIYKELIREQYEIDFLTFFDRCYHEEEYEQTSQIYKIPSRRKHPFRSKEEIKKLLRENGSQYNYIWIQMSSASNIDVQKYAKKYTQAKIISHCHAVRPETEGFFHTIIVKSLHMLQKRELWSLTDYAIACSKEALDYLFGKGFHGMKKVVCNGIELSKFIYDERYKINFRKENNIPINAVVMGHVGRFSPVKNHVFLIDLFDEYKKKNTNSWLVLIGTGPLEDKLKRIVKNKGINNVLFLGNRSDVNKLLSVMDYFVFPSLYEGMPISVVEAQASGLPVIMSDRIPSEVAITELVKELSLENGVKRWAETIYKLSLNKDRLLYNKKLQKTKFDLKMTVKSIKNILE